MSSFDVIVVGAGIVGSACARECVLAGLKTAIVEAGEPAGATTSAGMGHVVAMDDSPAQLALTRYSRAVWKQQAMGGDFEYTARGTLWIADDDEEMAEVQTREKRYREADIRAEILDPQAIAALEPNLRPGLAGGLLVKDDGICDPPATATFYLRDAQAHGAQLFRSRAVSAAQGEVALADGTTLSAGKIVLATGVECDLLPGLPLRKRKGHLILTRPLAGFLQRQIVELGYLKSAHAVEADSVAFNVQPRPSGQVLIGASRQYGNEDPGIDQPMVDQLLARARSFMPALASAAIDRIRTGFRAATPDKLPLIGPTADPSVFLAAGFEGLGITCAPGAARLLLAILLNHPPPIHAEPYFPQRFSL